MRFLVIVLLMCFLPQDVLAHGLGHTSGFKAGLLHPVLGLDHLLAMVSVGIVSTQISGRAIWTVPASFVLIMTFGGFAGMQSFDFLDINTIITLVEQGIIISVIALGFAIALDKSIPMWIAMLACGFFGFFHGFAHGVEVPDITFSLPYIGGFMIATTALHIVGVGIGEVAKKLSGGITVLRYTGAVILGIGLHIEYEYLILVYGFSIG